MIDVCIRVNCDNLVPNDVQGQIDTIKVSRKNFNIYLYNVLVDQCWKLKWNFFQKNWRRYGHINGHICPVTDRPKWILWTLVVVCCIILNELTKIMQLKFYNDRKVFICAKIFV